jgi:soluble lytic murein transglycosylase-like protein
MLNSSRKSTNILARLVLLGVLAFSAISATAQEQATTAAAPTNEIAAVKDFKSALTTLSALYEKDVQRLETQNAQLKQLFTEGLIARVEVEQSDRELASARAKVEEVALQIADLNKPLAAAPVLAANVIGSNQNWSTGNARIDGLIRLYGNQHGVDPYLVFCLMSQESGFKSGATSYKGAMGLMQLMPGTAARYGVTNPYDVAQNISAGTRYLKFLLNTFNGRVDLALAGYNAGEGAVMKYGNRIPPYNETQNYVRLIIARYGKKQTS